MGAEQSPGTIRFDPTDCDRMVVHQPGQIQPHGALLVARAADLVVLQASANTRRRLGFDPGDAQGRRLDDLLGHLAAEVLRSFLARESSDVGPRYALDLPPVEGRERLDVTGHARDGLLILEFEEPTAIPPGLGDPYSMVSEAVRGLQSMQGVVEFCQATVEAVRRFTGFDRVIAYRFAADFSGRVIAESRDPGFDSLLDQRFPAGDVPRPAREVMARNWLRLVPDIDYEPVPLIPRDNPLTGRPLDMSYCLLRHASGVCTTYLRNFGTACLMTMPLLRGGELWGMVTCHHRRPRTVPFALRAACELLAQVASLHLASIEDRETMGERLKRSSARDQLLAGLDRSADPSSWPFDAARTLAGYLPSDGLAIRMGERIETVGSTPDEARLADLFRWLDQHDRAGLFARDGLEDVYPEARSFADRACGLLAIDLKPWLPGWLAWFRREQVETVAWAGDPRKPVELGPMGEYLSPRRSFERWVEAVRGKGTPWTTPEVDAARILRESVIDRLRARGQQQDRLLADLSARKEEADSFAYMASHDLKEPLRGIHRYAHFLAERAGTKLDPDERDRLSGLLRLADRMGGLIESLLHLSQIGRLELEIRECDLDTLAAEAAEIAASRVADARAELELGPLPVLSCDRGWLLEVFVNLITNALKYNDSPQKRVQVGHRPPAAAGEPPIVFVRDNGIGIPERHREAVFGMFRRLHGREAYGGGAGAGLAIVRKIVERHGGRIWVEPSPGGGSTFCFTLAPGGLT
ncbi:MAG: ATP-binding protein [Isosphaeraceae bacterium]